EMLPTLRLPRPARRRLVALAGLWPFMRPYRSKLAMAFVLLCVGSAAMLTVPLALRNLVDHGFGTGAAINGYFLALFGIALFWGAAVAGRFYYVSWIGERVTADLRN